MGELDATLFEGGASSSSSWSLGILLDSSWALSIAGKFDGLSRGGGGGGGDGEGVGGGGGGLVAAER